VTTHTGRIEEIIEQIRNYEVISFDVFDTLIVREVGEPINVFQFLEETEKVKNFAKLRIIAELKARRSKLPEYEDITVDEIYSFLSNSDMKDKEISFEKKTCVANPVAYKLYEEALKNGKRVIAISDMYLPENVIMDILVNAGYTQIERLFVSGGIRKSKGSGTLFEYAIQCLQVNKKDLMHIGDNKISDYESPRSLGIHAAVFPTLKELATQSEYYNPTTFEGLVSIEGWLVRTMIERKLAVGDFGSYFDFFGYHYTSLLLNGFVLWLKKQCDLFQIKRLYFVARDGYIIKEAFDRLYPDCGIQTVYMYASRRMYYFAGITALSDEVLDRLTATYYLSEPVIEYISRLSLDCSDILDEAEIYFGDLNYIIKDQSDLQKIRAFFLQIENKILRIAESERVVVKDYLENIAMYDYEKKALIDVGWAASTQKCLEKDFGINNLYGFYFGLNKWAYDNDQIFGWIYHYGNPKKHFDTVQKALEIVELMFSAPEYSIITVRKENDYFIPVVNKTESEKKRIELAKQIQQGTLEAMDELQLLRKKYSTDPELSTVFVVMKSLFETPTEADVMSLASVPHNPNWGSDKYYQILTPLSYELLIHHGSIEAFLENEKGFWKPGQIALTKYILKKDIKYEGEISRYLKEKGQKLNTLADKKTSYQKIKAIAKQGYKFSDKLYFHIKHKGFKSILIKVGSMLKREIKNKFKKFVFLYMRR
jgi:HAD superfamily hydrolase (TIGR01549 family)